MNKIILFDLDVNRTVLSTIGKYLRRHAVTNRITRVLTHSGIQTSLVTSYCVQSAGLETSMSDIISENLTLSL